MVKLNVARQIRLFTTGDEPNQISEDNAEGIHPPDAQSELFTGLGCINYIIVSKGHFYSDTSPRRGTTTTILSTRITSFCLFKTIKNIKDAGAIQNI